MKDTEIEKLARDTVNEEFKKALVKHRKNLLFIIGSVTVILTMFGVLTKGQVTRALHNFAFPPGADQICISYEGNIVLRGDDANSKTGKLTFYAEPGQEVKIYAKVIHFLLSETDTPRRIVVSVDKQDLYEVPRDELTSGFFPITNKLKWDQTFETLPNIHDIAFSLDDTQPEDLTDEVRIICVVLVYG